MHSYVTDKFYDKIYNKRYFTLCSHSPFCSLCTPAASRSGSPRLISLSRVPRHSKHRHLHHSSASSSGKKGCKELISKTFINGEVKLKKI